MDEKFELTSFPKKARVQTELRKQGGKNRELQNVRPRAGMVDRENLKFSARKSMSVRVRPWA